MKTLKIIGLGTILIGLAWMIMSCTPKEEILASELNMIHELSYSDATDENVNWAEQNYQNKGFTLYVNEMKRTHLELKQSRENVIQLVSDLKQMRLNLKEENIQLIEEDQINIRESYQKLRFYRFILEDTRGQGYQQLLDLRENRDLYTKEQAKESLIDVYLVFQSRIKVFNDIYKELMYIQNILEQY